jgi:phage recombination protein bet|nr:MAG TPA: RecT protein [Caudoviricetes sp.]
MENKALQQSTNQPLIPVETVETLGSKTVIYESAGQEVKMNFAIVRNYLTRGNTTVSDTEIVTFINICRYNSLNPFLNEAYLIKFGNNPAQMIVSKEALMKRAEANPSYDGLEAGLILLRNNEVIEVEGNFHLPTDDILGAWAKVYRKDRSKPFVAKVNLSEYDKKQSSWNEKKATMIGKVAKVQALREAFPMQLGAIYSKEEQGVFENKGREVIDAEVIEQDEPTDNAQPLTPTEAPNQVDFKKL